MARKRQSEKNQEPLQLTQDNILDLGKNVGLTRMRDNTYANVYNWLPTGLPQYDKILGGGIPFGRITEVFGLKASGKSTFALSLSKVASDLGVITIWIDVEGTSDMNRLEQLGIDSSKVFAIQPEFDEEKNMVVNPTVEDIAKKLEELLTLFNTNYPNVPLLIVWDSIAATNSKIELDIDIESERPGIKGRALAKFFNRVTPLINGSNTAMVAINQARDEMGMSFGFGNNYNSPGGKALEHVVSLQLYVNAVDQRDFRQKKQNSITKDNYSGHNMQIETKKSKVSRPQQKAKAFIASEYELSDGSLVDGFNIPLDLYFAALDAGVIKKASGWRKYTRSNGEEVSKRNDDWELIFYHNQDPDLIDEIVSDIYKFYFPKNYPAFDNTVIDTKGMVGMKRLEKYYEEVPQDVEQNNEPQQEQGDKATK